QYTYNDPLAFDEYSENFDMHQNLDLAQYKLIKAIDYSTSEYINLRLEAGDYLLSAQSTTPSGKNIRIDKIVNIVDFDKGKFGKDKLIVHRISQLKAEPGDKVVVDLGSG
ncbi:MAG TPA: hypothetical protein PKD85_19110, partial [Saprospiraceae bacterium]|nr:hypothetical protein [Saprospiraceae bacterium]